MKKILLINLIIFLINLNLLSQCPSVINITNNQSNEILIYIYDENFNLIGVDTCFQAGSSSNINCNNILENLLENASYLSFGNLEEGDGGNCVYDTTGTVVPDIFLPIELSSFTAKYVNNYNYVEWVTETEINNDYFRLERSVDGENWIVLDKINGVGTTQVQQKYNYIDRGFENEINYYKLTQVDFDGTKHNKGVISINNTKKDSEIIGIYNALGQAVTMEYTGLKIVQYSDGSSKKIY
jgi:hypothetical protein